MNATILHESRGRIRFRLRQKQMTLAQADLLEAWLQGKSWTRQVTVHERTCAVILYYDGDRQTVLEAIRQFSWQEAERTTSLPAHSTRALNREFEEKLVTKVVCKAACTLFLPSPLRIARILWHMIPFVRRGLHCLLRRRIKVELLDALSISISACRRDFGTAGMVMFLLEVGELLEEWTRKNGSSFLRRTCMASCSESNSSASRESRDEKILVIVVVSWLFPALARARRYFRPGDSGSVVQQIVTLFGPFGQDRIGVKVFIRFFRPGL